MNRRLFGFLVFLVSPLLWTGGEDRIDLERQILTGLAKRQNVAAQLDLYLDDETAGRRAPRPQSQVGRELRDALVALEGALPRTEAGLPRALDAYDALRGADLLMRDHFRGVAERLEEHGIGGEILVRLREAESRYLERIERIRYCFMAGTLVGTLVATELGLRPIEEIEVGERVWARDEETGEIVLQPVTELFVTPSQETLELELEASDGTIETLGATYGHPFWVEGKGWTPAGELVAGDVLFTERDGWLRVRQVRGSPGVRTVYNLEVKEDHNYFVGLTRAWVHNKLCEDGRKQFLENLRANREVIEARNFAARHGHARPTAVIYEDLTPTRTLVSFERGRKTAIAVFEPKGRGSKFQNPITNRFIKQPREVKVEPAGAIKAEKLDITTQLHRAKAQEGVAEILAESRTATSLLDAIELAVRRRHLGKK